MKKTKKRQPIIAVVIPTIRDLSFLASWSSEFKNHIGIVIEDAPKKKIRIPPIFKSLSHYDWTDIDRDLGKDSWIIPRKNAGIRSYGFLKAFQMKADVIITLDDDCYPLTGQSFVKRHLANLTSRAPKDWFATYPHPDFMHTRGFPYAIRNRRKILVSHGLWSNIIDLDAKTQLKNPLRIFPPVPPDFPLLSYIPENYFFPLCSMNLAFKREAVPLMYFPPMGYDTDHKPWGYDRFDDIWAGLFAKKIMDHLGYAVANGTPFVEHRRASDIKENIKKEAAGIRTNETLYKHVANVRLTKKTMVGAYRELAEKIRFPRSRYFRRLKEAMVIWSQFFD